MAKEKIRIKDIARMAGVSATTVSNVIHGRTEKVSKKTRKRVEEILKEQEYTPSMGACMLSGRFTRMIAVIVRQKEEWQSTDPELGKILEEIERRLYEKNYYFLLHFVRTAEEVLLYTAAWKLDGIISIRLCEEEFLKISQTCEIPVVSMKRRGNILEKTGEEAGKFLVKSGIRKIWFLDGTLENGKEIWKGIKKIFSRKEIDLKEESYLEIPKDKDLRRMFYKIRLAGLAFSADALVFASEIQGAEALGYLHDLEIAVPEEIKVLGIGNDEAALQCRPRLTTVEYDLEGAVKHLTEELFQKMIKGYIVTKTEKIRVKTIIRESWN